MTLLTQLPGHIRLGDHGSLRVVIGGVEHLVTANDAVRLLYAGDIALLRDPDPTPLLLGEPRRKTGHIVPSRDDGDVTPHLIISIRSGDRDGQPGRLYLAQKAEAVAVLEGRLDICMVVSV